MRIKATCAFGTAGLGLGLSLLSCSSGPGPAAGEQRQGNVGLELTPVSGVTLNSVNYVVTNPVGSVTAEGDLPTSGAAKSFSFGLQLPVGTGYRISFSARSLENADVSCTGSSGPLDVTPNSASQDGSATLSVCYCGTLATASACSAAPFDLSQPGPPNGACAAVIQAGMTGITTNAVLLGNLLTLGRPAGAALHRLNCERTADGGACADSCGFTVGGPAFP